MFDSDTSPTLAEFVIDSLVETPVYDSTTPLDTTYTLGDPTLLDCELQIMPDNCAVEAERSIVNLFIDTPLTQQDAMYISASNGWYHPGDGTAPADVGGMMDLYGIPNHTVMNANVADLARELAQGHGVIVSVDSQELWDRGPLAELKQWLSSTFGIDFGNTGADHAVVVTGIDVTDPSNPMVIINDSGVPGGQGQPYPMDKFLQSWEDSNCYYTATDIPLPAENLAGAQGDVLVDIVGDFVGGFTGGMIAGLVGDPTLVIPVAEFTDTLIEETFSDDGLIASL